MVKKIAAALLAAVLVLGAAGCGSSNESHSVSLSDTTSATSALDTVNFVEAVTDKDLRGKNVDYLVQHGYTKNTDNDILSYCKQGEHLGYPLTYKYQIDEGGSNVSCLSISFGERQHEDIDIVKNKYTKLADELNKIGAFVGGSIAKINPDKGVEIDSQDLNTPYDVLLALNGMDTCNTYSKWQVGDNRVTLSVTNYPKSTHPPLMLIKVD